MKKRSSLWFTAVYIAVINGALSAIYIAAPILAEQLRQPFVLFAI